MSNELESIARPFEECQKIAYEQAAIVVDKMNKLSKLNLAHAQKPQERPLPFGFTQDRDSSIEVIAQSYLTLWSRQGLVGPSQR